MTSRINHHERVEVFREVDKAGSGDDPLDKSNRTERSQLGDSGPSSSAGGGGGPSGRLPDPVAEMQRRQREVDARNAAIQDWERKMKTRL